MDSAFITWWRRHGNKLKGKQLARTAWNAGLESVAKDYDSQDRICVSDDNTFRKQAQIIRNHKLNQPKRKKMITVDVLPDEGLL